MRPTATCLIALLPISIAAVACGSDDSASPAASGGTTSAGGTSGAGGSGAGGTAGSAGAASGGQAGAGAAGAGGVQSGGSGGVAGTGAGGTATAGAGGAGSGGVGGAASGGSAGTGGSAGAAGSAGSGGAAPSWEPMVSQTTNDFRAVWGVHPRNFWAVADATVRHYVTGNTWSSVDSASVTGTHFDVVGPASAGAGTQDVWVVGSDIDYYFQSSWSGVGLGGVVTGPATSTLKVGLREVMVAAQNGVFQYAVGDTTWAPVGTWPSGVVPVALWRVGCCDVYASSDSTVYHLADGSSTWVPDATGFTGLGRGWATGTPSSYQMYVVTSDGVLSSSAAGDWQKVHGSGSAWNGVWGTGPADIFFVGDAGGIAYFDGAVFRNHDAGTSVDLADVSGAEPTSPVYAVGDAGTILRFMR